MNRLYRFVSLFLLLLAGCASLPFGAQGSEPRPRMLYCEYSYAHDRIQFTPDAQYLLAGNCLWPLSEPVRERPVLNLNSKPVERNDERTFNLGKNAFRFYPALDQPVVLVLDFNGIPRLLSLEDRRLVDLPGAGEVNQVLVGPAGRLVLREVEAISLWDLAAEKRLAGPLANEAGPVRAGGMALSPDGRLLAVWSGPRLDLFDAATGAFLRELGPAAGAVQTALFSPDSQSVAAASAGGQLAVYAVDGALRAAIEMGEGAVVDKLLFSADSTRLAASAANQRLLAVWQAADGAQLQAIAMPVETAGRIFRWSLLPGGELFAIFDDGMVAAWSLADGRPIYAGEKAEFANRTIAVWPDYSKFVVYNGNLTVYNAKDGSQVSVANVLESTVWQRATGGSSGDVAVESLAVSPDLRYVAIQLVNQSAILWPLDGK